MVAVSPYPSTTDAAVGGKMAVELHGPACPGSSAVRRIQEARSRRNKAGVDMIDGRSRKGKSIDGSAQISWEGMLMARRSKYRRSVKLETECVVGPRATKSATLERRCRSILIENALQGTQTNTK